jgi:hypothetical protein
MVSASEDAVEDTPIVLISVTEKRGNLKNNLRKDMLNAVRNLRKEFAKIKIEVEDKNKLIVNLEMKAAEMNSTLKTLQCGMSSKLHRRHLLVNN